MPYEYNKIQHSPEAQEWYYLLMNDPEYFERWRYIDSINVYNSIIEQFQKLYDKTPMTDRIARSVHQMHLMASLSG